jgi:hypothetical protein
MYHADGKFFYLSKLLKKNFKSIKQETIVELFIDFESGKIRLMIDGKDKGVVLDNDASLKSGKEFFFVIRSLSKNTFKLFKKPTKEEEAREAELQKAAAAVEESK